MAFPLLFWTGKTAFYGEHGRLIVLFNRIFIHHSVEGRILIEF